jgi:hypothetical protein
MELDCIPAGMELFPAADEEQFEFIKRVINDCDYYLLIVGGRYGSTGEDGISYTEKEYDYALGRGLKVIALLHENPDEIPLGKSEKDPQLRERLRLFRDRVATGRLVKFWKTAEELPGLVALSLTHAIKMFPAVGWIRANKAPTEEVLSEINELRKDKAELQATVLKLSRKPEWTVKDLAGLDEETTLKGRYWYSRYNEYRDTTIKTTWREIFRHICPYLVKYPSEDYIKTVLQTALGKESDLYNFSLDDQDFQTIAVQLKALGLVKIDYSETTQGGYGLFWSLTPEGEQLLVELRTVRSGKKDI